MTADACCRSVTQDLTRLKEHMGVTRIVSLLNTAELRVWATMKKLPFARMRTGCTPCLHAHATDLRTRLAELYPPLAAMCFISHLTHCNMHMDDATDALMISMRGDQCPAGGRAHVA